MKKRLFSRVIQSSHTDIQHPRRIVEWSCFRCADLIHKILLVFFFFLIFFFFFFFFFFCSSFFFFFGWEVGEVFLFEKVYVWESWVLRWEGVIQPFFEFRLFSRIMTHCSKQFSLSLSLLSLSLSLSLSSLSLSRARARARAYIQCLIV